jgi:hypothetical protein
MTRDYSWGPAYVAAILETDDGRIPFRIREAWEAIEQRLFSPLEVGSAEEKALRRAQLGLVVLRRERIEGQFDQKRERPEANPLPRSRGSYSSRAGRRD